MQFRLADAGKSERSKKFYANDSPIHIDFFAFAPLAQFRIFTLPLYAFIPKTCFYLEPALLSSSTSTIGGTAPSAANAPASAARLRNAIGIE